MLALHFSNNSLVHVTCEILLAKLLNNKILVKKSSISQKHSYF